MTEDAPAPRKRSLFKRAAWQDAPKDEDGDMFSHANEFPDIVAAENKRREEAARKRKHEERGRKRRKVSSEAPTEPGSGLGSSSGASKSSTKERSKTPISPIRTHPPPDSLAARYDALAKPTASNNLTTRKASLVIDLDDDEEPSYDAESPSQPTPPDQTSWHEPRQQSIPVRPVQHIIADDDEPEEVLDPTLAALAARARERAAQNARSAASPTADESSNAPVVQLLIQPEIPDTKPLMVKVRIDSTTEKVRRAWCEKQGFSPGMAKTVFFTNKGLRIYDSTTIRRLGVVVDKYGNVTLKGDLTIYDDVNLPKITVEAWTEELLKQRKAEDAAEAAARKKAAEAPLVVEERTPTPEPEPKVKKIRIKLKAKGKPDFGIQVNMDTTFGHLATAYKQANNVDKKQPITLMFDGERLMPLDTIADVDIEDMDAIDVLFK